MSPDIFIDFAFMYASRPVSLTMPDISSNSRSHAANMADLQLTRDAIWALVDEEAVRISIQLRCHLVPVWILTHFFFLHLISLIAF